jgi:hypothetical protein
MKAVPFVIGITGHRDLNEKSSNELLLRLNQFFDEVDILLPNTPIEVLSGMADGADRLLVKVAQKRNLAVHVVLPMAEHYYFEDFSKESISEFRQLLSYKNTSTSVVSSPWRLKNQGSPEGDERDELYNQLGHYLIKHSTLLVGVWDGLNTGFSGGTGDVILSYVNAKKIDVKVTVEDITFVEQQVNAKTHNNVVYWLPISPDINTLHEVMFNKNNAFYITGNLGFHILNKEIKMPQNLNNEIQSLDKYNQQVEQVSNSISTEYSLLNGLDSVESESKLKHLKAIDDAFLNADAVALANQNKSDKQFKLFSIMAAAMGLLFLIYAKIVASKLLLVGYLTLFFVGWFYFRQSQKKENFTQHLSARVLAETLRAQFYLAIINRSDDKKAIKLLDITGVSQFTGFNWLNKMISQYASPSDNSVKSDVDKNITFVTKLWIDEQVKYFKDKTTTLSAHHHKLEKIKAILFGGSAVMALLLIFLKTTLFNTNLFANVDAKTFTVLLMGLLPFWLSIWEIYQSKMATKELLWQYQNQYKVFSQAKILLDNANSVDDKLDILEDLAERSMMENYIWITHRFHREQEPPTAG